MVAAAIDSQGLGTGVPQVSSAAMVHPAAQVGGNVQLQAGVHVAPGAVVQAVAGATCYLDAGVTVLEGATIQATSRGQVLGDNQRPYAIWIGAGATITYKAIISGAAYLGENAFVGFRSTLFNVRLGAGAVVMMHALVQDVEVPPGKLVPSGAVVTTQAEADRLPDATAADWALVKEILAGRGQAGGTPSPDVAGSKLQSTNHDGFTTMQNQQLTADVVQMVRQYLAQGLRIGTEHADARRYRSNVWQTCSPIQATREGDVLAALDACLTEHAGEYVRIFGIDPVAKQRVAPVTVQRPDGKPVAVGRTAVPASSSAPAAAVGGLAPEVVQQVRQYLAQGFRIGTEHADARRYRSNVWQTCSPIQSDRESDVLAALSQCLADHGGEYVRLFGIDPVAKRRVAPITIQHPGGTPALPSTGSGAVPSGGTSVVPSGMATDASTQIRQWLQMGYRIGAEHADARRYRSNVWQSCPPISARNEGEAMAAIQACLADHAAEYVRIFGIDPVAKRRVAPVTIQRPGQAPAPAPASASSNGTSYAASNGAAAVGSNGAAGPLPSDLVQQVKQLLNQGYRVSLEHADRRRYRSGAWQTSAALEGMGARDVLAALESRLQQHQGEYVRLIGIDPKAKRRVLETTIQRP